MTLQKPLDLAKILGIVLGIATLIGVIFVPFKLYFDVQSIKDKDLKVIRDTLDSVQREQSAGKERADERQEQVKAYIDTSIDTASATGRAAREGLEARIRAQEQANAAFGATLQGMSATLNSISSDLREMRNDLRDDKPASRRP